ncbi:MAG: hypothetical protein IT535_00700 [Bauldia sp.]|nr:hypothetical protein [Bauldia sp.]
MAKLRKAKPSEIGVVTVDGGGIIKCTVTPSSVDRLEAILPPIIQAASLQGFELVAGEGPAQFKSAKEVVGFSISETAKRESHVVTDAERAKEEEWQRKRDRAARRNSWDSIFFDRPRFPEWDYHPTGHLSFELEHVYLWQGGSPRRSFRDAKTQRLEKMAGEIAVGLAVLAAAKTEQRLEQEAWHQAYEEEKRRRELADRIKHIEERLVAGLRAILNELDELDRLRPPHWYSVSASLCRTPDATRGLLGLGK